MTAVDPNYNAMDIMEPNLTWEIDDEGWAIASGEELTLMIDPDNVLLIFRGDKCKVQRNCVDFEHAAYIADSFEREAIRNAQRGWKWKATDV